MGFCAQDFGSSIEDEETQRMSFAFKRFAEQEGTYVSTEVRVYCHFHEGDLWKARP